MSKKLFVGNLPYSVTDSQLEEHFTAYGEVESAHVVQDRMTGRSRGFGFVEMTSDSDTDTAVETLNGTDMGGRSLTVSEARQREPRGR